MEGTQQATTAKDRIKVVPLKRVCFYNKVRLPPAPPSIAEDRLQQHYSTLYPDILTATLAGPEPVGGELHFHFTRAVGYKG